MPRHAFSEADRLFARPDNAAASPAIVTATECWNDDSRKPKTRRHGRQRAHEIERPVIRRAIAQIQSATSLRLMLRDPLAFICSSSATRWVGAQLWRTSSL
jgi:hypothetical protein